MDFVFVVYHNVIGDSGSIFIYAICGTDRKAKIARDKAAGFKKNGIYYNVDPESTPYAIKIRILEVAIDRLYSLGVLAHVHHCDLNSLGVIS
jgi:hypothetical protein